MSQFGNNRSSIVAPFQAWRKIAGLALLGFVYWLFMRLGLLLVAQPEGIASIWPVSGLALAVLVLRSKKEWSSLLAVIFITNILGNWSGGNSLVVSFGFALVNTLEPAVCAWIMISLRKAEINFERDVDVFALVAAAVLGNGLTALLGASIPTLAYGASFVDAWKVWWVADGLGMMLVAPLIITWVNNHSLERFAKLSQFIEAGLLVLALVLFTGLVFGPFTLAEEPLLRTYMFFPFLIWLAFRFPPRGMAQALIVVAAIAVWGTLHGRGIFAFTTLDQAERLMAVQMFLSVLAFSGLLISAIVAGRKLDTEKLRAAEANYRNIFENAPVGFFQSSPLGNFLNVNPQMARIFGFESPAEMIAGITDIGSQIYVESVGREEFRRSITEEGQVFEFVQKNRRKDGSIIMTTTNARAVKDSKGDILYYEGFLKDVTEIKEAEQTVRESQEFVQDTLDSLSAHVCVLDEDGTILAVNKAWSDFANANPPVMGNVGIGANYLAVCDAASGSGSELAHEFAAGVRAVASGALEIFKQDYACHSPDAQRWFVARVLPFENRASHRVVIAHENITERMLAEDALRRSEAKFRAVVENSDDGILFTDANAVILYRSPSYQRINGFSDDERLMHNGFDTIHPDDQDMMHQYWAQIIENPGKVVKVEYRVLHKDGGWRWAESTGQNLLDNPDIQLVVIRSRNITERKQVEDALRKSEAKFRAVIENSSDGILFGDANAVISYRSPSYSRINGFSDDERLGRSGFETVHPDDQQMLHKYWAQVVGNPNQALKTEYRIRHKDGSWRWVESTGQNLLDNPDIQQIVVSSRDITERKLAEDAQHESENNFRILFDTMTEGVALNEIIYDENGEMIDYRILQVNAAFYATADYDGTQVVGSTATKLYGMTPESIKDFWLEHRNKNSTAYTEMLSPLSQRWFFIATSPFSEDKFVTSFLDITERKQAEAALRASEERARALLGAVPDLVFRLDSHGVFLDYKAESSDLYTSSADIIGKNNHDLTPPEFANFIDHQIQRTLETGVMQTFEYELPIPVRGMRQYEARMVSSGKDEVTAIVRDITERKHAEKALQESEEKYRKLFSEMTSGCSVQEIICDNFGQPMDYFTVDVNDAYEKLLGVPRDIVVGSKASGILPPEELKHWLGVFGPVALTGSSVHYEMYSPLNKKHFEGVAYSLGNHQFAVVFSDDTARKQAEEALRKREQEFVTLVENSPDMVVRFDTNFRHLYCNSAVERQLGRPPSVLLGKTPLETGGPRDQGEFVIKSLSKVLETGEEQEVEQCFPTPLGMKYFQTRIVPERDAQGKTESLLAITRDVTEHRKAENALAEKTQELDRYFTSSLDLLCMADTDGYFRRLNPEWEKSLGYSLAELEGKRFLDFVHRDDLDATLKAVERLGQQEAVLNFENRYRCKDGSYRWMEWRATPIGNLIYAVARDVTERNRMQDELQKVNNDFARAQEIAHIGSWEDYLPTGDLHWSDEMCRIMGFQPGYPVNLADAIKCFPPDELVRFQNSVNAAIEQDAPYSMDYKIIRPDGEERFIHDEGVIIRDDSGQAIWMFGATQDITERKLAEEALRESEERYRRLTGAITDYIYSVMVEHGKAVGTSHGPGCVAVTGYTSKEFAADPYLWYRMIWPEDRGLLQDDIQELLAGHEVFREHRITRKDGQLRWIRDTLSPHFNERRELVGYDGLIQDITARKRAEEALRESEEHYRRIVDTAYEGIWVVGEDYQTTFINDRMKEMLGYSVEEMLGKRVDAFLYETNEAETRQVKQHLRHIGGQKERCFRRKDGSQLWTLVSAKPIIDEQGHFKGSFAMFSDITERKQAEVALQKFAFIANTAPEFMSFINRQYVYESVNDAYCRARGKARSEFIGHSLSEVWGESIFQKRLQPYFEQCFAGEIVRYEETFVFSGTDLRNYQVGMYPYRTAANEQVTHVVVVTSDITEYKQAETALRLSALNLKKAQHFAHVGSWTWDIKNNHVDWSDEMYNIFDVDKETFTGSLPQIIQDAIHPDDRAKVNASNLSVITEGNPVPLDYRIIRKDGSIRVVWAEAGELVRDETGQPSLLSGTVQDITERKQMEEDLRASLAEKEALLKEVHHRVKNNLQIISSLLSMQASNSQDKLVAHALEESKDRVRAMALIHEKLYQSKNLEYIQAEEYISELVDQLASSFAGQMRNVSLEMQIADLTLDINKAIPCGMIINELVSNALKYAFPAQRGGLIRVCLDIHDGRVRLVISDNGVGLPENVNVQHPETLGLELVSILSHQLKASLEVIRQSGTTFTITFSA